MAPVSVRDVEQAGERVSGFVVRTPVLPFLGAALAGDNQLWLKCENLQRTSSFKIRGAYNAVSGLNEAERTRGVITYSSGNHGQAVACAAHALGINAVIVMPEDAVPLKVEATRGWGAEVVFAGHTSLHRQERAMELVEEHGYAVIPPFDDRRIIAGQGTAGLELIEQLPDVQEVVVQVGGGGLISGIATAVKARRPDVRVIGVEPEGAADARDSLRNGRLTTWDRIDTVADGLRTSRIGELNFATISELVDDIVTVTDDEIIEAMALLATQARLVAEPSGAVAPAAVLFGRTGLAGNRVLAVISGGNVDPALLASSLERSSHRQVAPVHAG
ncbi:MAG TPA: threonine/serine dehydratase [Chloroflexota bacterium]|nr:threonine/serine dehydratase [Chloroflexota bacterium]